LFFKFIKKNILYRTICFYRFVKDCCISNKIKSYFKIKIIIFFIASLKKLEIIKIRKLIIKVFKFIVI